MTKKPKTYPNDDILITNANIILKDFWHIYNPWEKIFFKTFHFVTIHSRPFYTTCVKPASKLSDFFTYLSIKFYFRLFAEPFITEPFPYQLFLLLPLLRHIYCQFPIIVLSRIPEDYFIRYRPDFAPEYDFP